MKTKAIVTLILLSVTSMAWANGGRSIDNVDANNIAPTPAEVTKIQMQEPTDQFDATVDSVENVGTSSLQQAHGNNINFDTSAYDEINLL